MYDYGSLVFLDNQKTGSTYVSQFLASCCALPHVKSQKHHPIRNDYRRDTVYFSTVRHPVDLYISLYRYGLDKKGSTFKRLRRTGRLDLYKRLPDWLDFVLSEDNAEIFLEGYSQFAPLGVGFMSFRAMRITLKHPLHSMSAAKSYDGLIDIWSKGQIANHIFRQENLNESLSEFATKTVPQFFHQEAVKAFLDTAERVNVSRSESKSDIPEELRQRILDKERFLIERFYPA